MTTQALPRVSVLVPAYNAGSTLSRALDSLLRQTFDDFEVVVVNDGSTDATEAIAERYAWSDSRVRVVRNDNNLGLVAALGAGVQECRGDLVARLDADDAAMPGRLSLQVEVFDRSPSVVLCATAYARVDPAGLAIRESVPPLSHGALAIAMTIENRLCHSSVMLRRAALLSVGGYDASWFPVEDYDLWLRMMEVGEYRGLADVLVRYTENPAGISATTRAVQDKRFVERRRAYRLELDDHDDTNPTGRPRAAWQYRQHVAAELRERGIGLGGLDEATYRIAMAGAGSPLARRVRCALTAPQLVALSRS